jgi:hypothetical protein
MERKTVTEKCWSSRCENGYEYWETGYIDDFWVTTGPPKKVKCDTCNGTGKIEVTYEQTNEKCRSCKGTGKLYEYPSQYLPFLTDQKFFETKCKLVPCDKCYGTGKHWEKVSEKPYSGCFLTEACVKHRGLQDDCHLLKTLGSFRDTYVRSTAEGCEKLKLYYQISP